MSDVYEELVEAGAPRLPEGLFYRIKEWMPDFAVGVYEVDLRRRGRWLSSSVVARGVPWAFDLEEWRKQIAEQDGAPDVIEDVDVFANACASIYAEHERQIAEHAATVRARRFLGDHP